MKLYLVRHGDYVPPEKDPSQPLTEEAKKKLERFSLLLRALSLDVAKIYHSGKLRARQTADILARCLILNMDIEEHSSLNPNEDPEKLLNELEAESKNILIVSHLPFLETLLFRLLGNRFPFDFQPGCFLCLRKERAGWVLSWALSPNDLKDNV